MTPSTRPAISSPKRSPTSSSEALRVLDGVVQQRRAQRLGVQAHAGADLRHADRMDDELLAGAAGAGRRGGRRRRRTLPPRGRDRRAARLLGVLLDDREQVAQQPLLEGAKARRADRLVRARTARSRRPAGGRRPAPSRPVAAGPVAADLPPAPHVTAADGSAQAPARRFALLRNRCPSSYRCGVDPERGRALERRRRPARDRQGRQIPVEADELELREHPHQAPASRAERPCGSVAAKQALELLAGRPLAARAALGREATSEARSPYSSSCICSAKRSSGAPQASWAIPLAGAQAPGRSRRRRRIERDELREAPARRGSRSSSA